MTDKNNNEKNSYIGYGVGFGLLGGAIFSSIIGIFFEFPLIWAFWTWTWHDDWYRNWCNKGF